MSKEILTLVDALASEKNVDREIVFSALEFALATAAKKRFEQDHIEVRTEINRESGEYQNYRRWLIVKDEDYTYPDTEMTEEEIEEKFPGMHLDAGEYYEEKIENVEFGRIGAQTAKQVILQRIRDAEQGRRAGEQFRLKIGAQAIADDRDIRLIRQSCELQNLCAGEELRFIHQHASERTGCVTSRHLCP